MHEWEEKGLQSRSKGVDNRLDLDRRWYPSYVSDPTHAFGNTQSPLYKPKSSYQFYSSFGAPTSFLRKELKSAGELSEPKSPASRQEIVVLRKTLKDEILQLAERMLWREEQEAVYNDHGLHVHGKSYDTCLGHVSEIYMHQRNFIPLPFYPPHHTIKLTSQPRIPRGSRVSHPWAGVVGKTHNGEKFTNVKIIMTVMWRGGKVRWGGDKIPSP